MTSAWDQFDNLTEWDLELHMEFGDDAKHAIKGARNMLFQLESRGSMEVKNVLWVSKLRLSLISISTMEKEGFYVAFQDGKG